MIKSKSPSNSLSNLNLSFNYSLSLRSSQNTLKLDEMSSISHQNQSIQNQSINTVPLVSNAGHETQSSKSSFKLSELYFLKFLGEKYFY